MFFVFGINNSYKKLEFAQNIFCNVCGQYGHYDVYVSFMVFSLFFIPIFKWNKHYYAVSSCCSTTYEITKEAGKRIENGENFSIMEEDILNVKEYGNKNGIRKCPICGQEINTGFLFCPHCGNKL